MKPLARKYFNSVKILTTEAKNASSWNLQHLTRFVGEINWVKHIMDIQAAYLDNGGGGGQTCVTQCANEYNQCVTENQCDTGGWVCLCCVPCSLQYMGCIGRCSIPGAGSSGGIFIY